MSVHRSSMCGTRLGQKGITTMNAMPIQRGNQRGERDGSQPDTQTAGAGNHQPRPCRHERAKQ